MTICQIFSQSAPHICLWMASLKCIILHRGVVMFEAVVPLLGVSFAHSITAKGQLNLLDGLSLNITKPLAKYNAISLLNAFGHLV